VTSNIWSRSTENRRSPQRKDELKGQAMAGTQEKMTSDAPIRYADASTQRVKADNGIEYAHRDLGESDVPLVLLQHFRGNLDNWDPALVDALAADRRVLVFDNVGVAGTAGSTPNTVEAMAHGAIAFLEAMGLKRVDLLGFSIGSFVAQEIALIRPDLLRRVVLASSAPQGAAGMHGWAPEVIGAVGAPETTPEGYLSVFFAPTQTSLKSGQQAAGRIFSARRADRDVPTTWQTRQAQYDAVCAWGIPNHSLLERVSTIHLPVFVANGDRDPMILPRYSYLLAGLLPNARLTIYPDSAHGFLFQHHSQFAADVHAFLEEAD
jgi:pimeloyl-ACP methyl ester carboxylesterase